MSASTALLQKARAQEKSSVSPGHFLCCCCCFCSLGLGLLLVGTGMLAVERNHGCRPSQLENVTVPFGGEVLPRRMAMVERDHWLHYSSIVDVHEEDAAANASRVGYFFNTNFIFWMRFGYADAENRVWFEARHSYFLSPFHPMAEYDLVRCDEDHGAAPFRVVEDWAQRTWFCFFECRRSFLLYRRGDELGHGANISSDALRADGADGVDAKAGGYQHAATAIFDSELQHRAIGARPAWRMNLTDATDESLIASAEQRRKQRFAVRGLSPLHALSRWVVQVEEEEPRVPTWAIGFMAALDDVTQHEETDGSGHALRHSRNLARTVGPHAAHLLAKQEATESEQMQGESPVPPPPAAAPPPCQDPVGWTPTCVNMTWNQTAPPPLPAQQRRKRRRNTANQLLYDASTV